MTGHTRLAVLESGEPAVRVLAAVGNHNGRAPSTVTTVLVHGDAERQPWYAREADESLALGVDSCESLVAGLRSAGIDMVWPGVWPGLALPALVAACEEAGLTVVGPSSATHAALADPETLADAGRRAGVEPLDPDQERDQLRLIEADVLRDGAGTTWPLGLREATVVCPRGQLMLAESPAPFLSGGTEAQLLHTATTLLESVGYVGAGVVRFLVSPDGERWWLDGVDPLARPEHALTEESTGASFVGLRLRIALGGRLDPEPPRADGWAVEVRLLAHDTERGHAPSSGRLHMLSLPVGTGVRVDASLREGDTIDGAVDPVLGTMSAWGRDRTEAFRRLRRALERTTVVLETGMSNRAALLALLGRPELREGPVGRGWYVGLDRAGELTGDPDPIALLAAAVEAYELDLGQVRGAFFASARRGRPENPEAVGARVHLEYRGARYRLRVDRSGPTSYRIHDGSVVDLTVERIGDFERRLTCAGRRHRVVTLARDTAFRVEVDGVAHVVTRVDGARCGPSGRPWSPRSWSSPASRSRRATRWPCWSR